MKSIQSNIKKAKKYLDKYHCVAVPTETVYGLAGNAYSDVAVKKIFKLKERPMNNPLIVHYYSISRLKEDSKISKYVTNNKKSLAVRFPRHALFKNLLKQLDYPLAAPSACLLYTSPSPRDGLLSRMPSSA